MSHDANRNRSLKRAVITSISGKGVSVITQLVAIPLAVSALGLERFGVYAMLTAIFLWMNTASTVVGSALTLKISAANAKGDATKESELFSSAFFFAVLTAATLILVFNGFLSVFQLNELFNLKGHTYDVELGHAARLVAFLVPANVVFTLAESSHAGYQKQYLNNLLSAGANIFTISGLILVQHSPSVPHMVLAMFLPATISRAINLAILLRTRPHLFPSRSRANWPALRTLFVTGAGFALMQIGSLAYQQFSIFYVGRHVGLTAAAYFAMMMQVIAISGSFLIVFTQPLLPALSDAMARHDLQWIRRAHKLAITRLMPYVVLAASGIAVFGSIFASFILRHDIELSLSLRCLWAAFFLIVAWEHIGYIFLAGTGQLWAATGLYLLGALTMLSGSLILVPAAGVTGEFLAMCLGPLIFTAITYPTLVGRMLARGAVHPLPGSGLS
jgi:O-antigen/teichoic acid export membrane protein